MSEYGMSKMENNEIMNTNMEDIKMRTIKELLDSNVSREEMTVEEERAFVNYWFDLYEETGFLDKFHQVYNETEKFNGKPFEVLSRCKEGEWDLECLPAWNIKFNNGDTLEAYPEEICTLEQNG